VIAFAVIVLAYEPQNLRQRWRDIRAFLVGAIVFLTLFWLFFELVTRFGWYVTMPFVAAIAPGPFPSHPINLSHPNWITGYIWLAYYLLALIVLLVPEEAPANSTQLPLSRAIQGAPHWTHIEQCYTLFREALAAWSPAPVERLKTPTRFEYYQGD